MLRTEAVLKHIFLQVIPRSVLQLQNHFYKNLIHKNLLLRFEDFLKANYVVNRREGLETH